MSESILFVADFNIDTLARQIEHTAIPGTVTRVAPLGTVMPTLASGSPAPDWLAVVWTRPEAVSAAARTAFEYQPFAIDEILDDVRRYAGNLATFAAGTRATLVPTWVLPPTMRGYGPIDWKPGTGLAWLLARMNLTLADTLAGTQRVMMLDAARWFATTGARGWSDKLWYASKSPFALGIMEQAAADIRAAIDALEGRARRLVILDLDDLLWGGVVGESGWQGLILGGHDHAGEAYADFQRALKALTHRGVQLAIVSKNDEAVALEAIDRHPEMQLRRSDFAGWKINWDDKAANVEQLLTDLRLGPESAVFIDDSAIERARVCSAVPGVLVPDWPADPALFRSALASLRCFDTVAVTGEDRSRTAMYVTDRARRDSQTVATDLDAWFQSLGIVVDVERLNEANLERAAQLFNKTNQMNLSTRRLSGAELMEWASGAEHTMLTVRVADRFGDYGLTGVIGLAFTSREAHVTDLLLSCRVMGRNIERTMLHVAASHARARGALTLHAPFRTTARNRPFLEFLKDSGFRADAPDRFAWDLAAPYPLPAAVTLRDHSHAGTVNR